MLGDHRPARQRYPLEQARVLPRVRDIASAAKKRHRGRAFGQRRLVRGGIASPRAAGYHRDAPLRRKPREALRRPDAVRRGFASPDHGKAFCKRLGVAEHIEPLRRARDGTQGSGKPGVVRQQHRPHPSQLQALPLRFASRHHTPPSRNRKPTASHR